MQYINLNNGVKMPQLGFGVYQIQNSQMPEVMMHAFSTGYRSIDTAQLYGNESGLGKAIQSSEINREDLFITTKVWNSHHGYKAALEAFEESIQRLQIDYLDLYLVHWPAPDFDKYIETYQALETLYERGKVRAIGVCNFDIEHLDNVLAKCEVTPVVNQIECHPYFQQKEMKKYCAERNISVESWSPLYRGEEIFGEPIIQSLANKHNKTAAQIILRWHIQEGSIVIPKSVTPERIKENFDIFSFELSDDDMEKISSLNQNKRRGPIPKEMHIV